MCKSVCLEPMTSQSEGAPEARRGAEPGEGEASHRSKLGDRCQERTGLRSNGFVVRLRCLHFQQVAFR